MSLHNNKSIYTSRHSFTDRGKEERDAFADLTVRLSTLDTSLLLLSSEEEAVLIAVFKHLAEYARKQDENIAVLKEKDVLNLLLGKEIFIHNQSLIVRRFALFIATTLLEDMNTLVDLDTARTQSIVELCLRFYLAEKDDYCLEYLSVMINKCLDDPQVARDIQHNAEYLDKYFEIMTKTDNPDTALHSTEALHKMLQVQSTETMQQFAAHHAFPINRVLCDLTNEFAEVRSAALKVIKALIVDTSDLSPFAVGSRAIQVLEQLTRVLCDDTMEENKYEVVDALATGLRTEKMTQIFFEQNLFDKIVRHLEEYVDIYTQETKCRIAAIFAETAKFPQFLYRMCVANVTELFLECLLTAEAIAATHVVVGLNRMMKFPEAAKKIVAAYDEGLISKLLHLMENNEVAIKTREQSADLLCNLLVFSYHPTALELMRLALPTVLADIFGQGLANLSIDYILSLLNLIENLAQNNEYRSQLGESVQLAHSLGLLLKHSFSAAILVSSIFRCLCTLIEENAFRDMLLQTFLTASIKRGLKSLANLVKTAVTHFIMQTTRYPEYVEAYIEDGVLEVLILHQKHSFCVSTWGPAIDSVLSKTPSLKFCIRNHLGFTDTTVGHDFYVSTRKFSDFRTFLNILHEDVSPLYPIFLVNFQREENPSKLNVTVPPECFLLDASAGVGQSWCYCRKPGDKQLPQHLNMVNRELERHALLENPEKVKRCIDFDNIAKRAKVVAEIVAKVMGENLQSLDLNAPEECSYHTVKCHLKELSQELHCNMIPLGMVRSGCHIERAVFFKALADQIGLPCTLQRSVDGRRLFNEVPLPLELERDVHCDKDSLKYMPWRMLRPTHLVDLLYNVGELYPMQSRQALQYLRLY